MKKSVVLTSLLTICAVNPALAVTNRNALTSNSTYLQANSDYAAPSATATVLDGVSANGATVDALPHFSIAPGFYLPSNSLVVAQCGGTTGTAAGKYCTGLADVTLNTTTNQGLSNCPNGYSVTAQGAAAEAECYSTTCTISNAGINNATAVTGILSYSGGLSTCRATECGTGFGVSSVDVSAKLGVAAIGYMAKPESGNVASWGTPGDDVVSESGKWYVRYGSGSDYYSFYGDSECSTSMEAVVATTTGVSGARCYCKLENYKKFGDGANEYSMESYWVKVRDYTSLGTNCSASCATVCAGIVAEQVGSGWSDISALGGATTLKTKIARYAKVNGTQCTPNTFTVSFNANGGTGSCSSHTCAWESDCFAQTWKAQNEPDQCYFTNGTGASSKVLIGWNDVASTTKKYDLGENVKNIVSSGTKPLYAVWGTPTCDVSNGTGVVTDTVDNKPTCSITCDQGYHVAGTSIERNITHSGEAGQTSNRYNCSGNTLLFSWSSGHGTMPTMPQSCIYGGAAAQIPTMQSVTGYTFNGWLVENNSTAFAKTQAQSVACSFDNFKKYSGTVNITADWVAKTIGLSWDANGHGTVPSTKPTQCTYDGTFKAPNMDDVTGYTFDKWLVVGNTDNSHNKLTKNTDYDCTTTYLGTDTGPVTIQAQWTANNLTFNWNENGHGTRPTGPGGCTYGDSNVIMAVMDDVIGYSFTGWHVENNEQRFGSGQRAVTCNYDNFKKGSGTVNITAEWSANKINFTWVNGGHGTISNAPASCTYDVNFTPATISQVDGYTFGGWEFAKSGNSNTVLDNGLCTQDNLGKDKGDITFTAKWTPNNIKLKWEDGGHGTVPSNPASSCTYNSSFDMPGTPDAVTGYTFEGWVVKGHENETPFGGTQRAVSCNKDLLFSTGSDVTIVAKWTANTIHIKWFGVTKYNNEGPKLADGTAMNGVNATHQTAVSQVSYNDNIVTPGSNYVVQSVGQTFLGWKFVAPTTGSTHNFKTLDASVEATDWSAEEGKKDWVAYYNYGDISGTTVCSSTSGTQYTSGVPNEATSGEKCWCKATTYSPAGTTMAYTNNSTSPWVFLHDYSGDSSLCSQGCAIGCANHQTNTLQLRRALFGITQ